MTFAIVFASLIHGSADWTHAYGNKQSLLHDSLSVGINVQLFSAVLTALITVQFSSIPASFSGPDITHAVMIARMCEDLPQMTKDKEEAFATMRFLMALSSIVTSVLWLLMAKYNLIRLADFFPVSVVTGFLSCIGYNMHLCLYLWLVIEVVVASC